MADGISIDVSAVTRAATEMGLMGAEAVRVIEPVMERAAFDAKRDMQGIFRQHRHFTQVAPSVSYDRIGFLSSIGFEVGPHPDGDGGGLAGIAVEGGANGGGGTVDLQPVVDHIERTLPASLEAALGML